MQLGWDPPRENGWLDRQRPRYAPRMIPPVWRLALMALALPCTAPAQTLRSVVVPADATIVVAPRGAPVVAPIPNSVVVIPDPAPVPPPVPVAGAGLAALAPALLPLAAAVLLGATAPGSSGVAAAPASTR